MGSSKLWCQLIVVSSICLAKSSSTNFYKNYQYQYRNPPLKQSYRLSAQNFVAIPGKIVHQYREYPQYPVAPLIQPPLSRLTVPPLLQKVQLIPQLFRIREEFDTESSSPPPADSEDDTNQQAQPQPGTQPEDGGSQTQPGSEGSQPEEPPPGEEQPPPMNPPEENNHDHHHHDHDHHHHDHDHHHHDHDHQHHDHHHHDHDHPHHDHEKVIHKHVSIHIPPEEMDEDEVTVVRPKLPQPDKLVNIVFIKAPTPKKKKFEVILPDKPEQKTLIYILVKKPEASETIKVHGPPPTKSPPKPQVFFIKYKHKNGDNASPSYHIVSAKQQRSYHY